MLTVSQCPVCQHITIASNSHLKRDFYYRKQGSVMATCQHSPRPWWPMTSSEEHSQRDAAASETHHGPTTVTSTDTETDTHTHIHAHIHARTGGMTYCTGCLSLRHKMVGAVVTIRTGNLFNHMHT